MDLNELLSSLSPNDVNSLKSMASSLLGNSASAPEEERALAPTGKGEKQEHLFDSMPDIDPQMLMKIGTLMSGMNNDQDDERVSLIMALKPHLSPTKQKKCDEAARLMKMMEMLPAFKELGLFK